MKEEFSLQEKNITMKIHGCTLNGFTSVFPRVLERVFGNEVLLESLSFSFERIRYFGLAKLSQSFERIKHFDQSKLSHKIRAQVTYL